ncbi:MAG TPA: hypothetical protein VK894_10650 [Jiangellales bacterium]|nr:hypothetical protein [Jiangellales bacterium]
MKTSSAATRRHLPSSPFNDRPVRVVEQYAVGDRVTHDTYGLGRVVVEEAEAVTVSFGAHRVRIISPFSKLTKL